MAGLNVRIRPVRLDDAEAIQRIYAPIVLQTVISFEEVPPTVREMAERIEATTAGYPFLAAESEEGVIGYAYAGPHRSRPAYRWSVDVTAYVTETLRSQGVGRRLYEVLLAKLSAQGFHAAFARIALPNPASIALHEALGFRPVGVYREVGFKFDRWHDVGRWQKLL